MAPDKQKENPFIKNTVIFLLHPKVKLTNLRYNIAFSMVIVWFLFSLFYALNNGCPNESPTLNLLSCEPDAIVEKDGSPVYQCTSCLFQAPKFELDYIGNTISEFNAMFSAAANIIIILAALGFKTKVIDLITLSEKINYLSGNTDADMGTFSSDKEDQLAIDHLDCQQLDDHVIKINIDNSSSPQSKSSNRGGFRGERSRRDGKLNTNI